MNRDYVLIFLGVAVMAAIAAFKLWPRGPVYEADFTKGVMPAGWTLITGNGDAPASRLSADGLYLRAGDVLMPAGLK